MKITWNPPVLSLQHSEVFLTGKFQFSEGWCNSCARWNLLQIIRTPGEDDHSWRGVMGTPKIFQRYPLICQLFPFVPGWPSKARYTCSSASVSQKSRENWLRHNTQDLWNIWSRTCMSKKDLCVCRCKLSMSKPYSEQTFFTQFPAYFRIHLLVLSHGQKSLTRHKVWVITRRKHGLSSFLAWAQGTPQLALRKGRAHSHRIHNPWFTSAISALVPFQKLFGGCRLQGM